MNTKSLVLLASATSLWFALASCSGTETEAHTQPAPAAGVAPYRIDLLELANASASAMVVDPHVKTRSNLQQQVVEACVELEELDRALEFSKGIRNWRRGQCLADIVIASVREGRELSDADALLAQARRAAEGEIEGETAQKWRANRVHQRVAVAEKALVDPDSLRARLTDEQFGEWLTNVDAVLAESSFDVARTVLEACAELHERDYDDDRRRNELETRIRTGHPKLPPQARVELVGLAIETAVSRGDKQHAAEMVTELRDLVDTRQWRAETHVPLLAEIARWRFLTGSEDKARAELGAAEGIYREGRETIGMIFRAEALRPIARAWHAMGERDKALETYGRVLDETVETPNSRPRAEDLTQTLIAMAIDDFEPDAALWTRLRSIQSELGHPW